MKKYILLACLVALANFSYAQDADAPINSLWKKIACDSTITYRQIVATCDSMFAEAGYPVFPDTSVSDTTSGGNEEQSEEENEKEGEDDYDGSPFYNYSLWKTFYATRLDVATGKPHDFALAASGALSSSSSPSNCAGTSDYQSSMHTIPNIHGWQFIGPQNVTGGGSWIGTLEQHLGQVNSIIVNTVTPSEIYITDAWGGLWKTTNADLVPNNTWTCLSDNLPQMAGIGINNVFVDFSSSPHRLFCLAGVPWAICLQNNLFNNQHTIGIFYSLDDGATFSQMDISPTGINLTNDKNFYDPVLFMKYWPGNATSSPQYIFLSTKYHVYRLDITDPAAITSTTIMDITPLLPGGPLPGDCDYDRFRGFGEINFLPSDPTVMYVTTNSNNGEGYSATAGLYRISDCNCTSCTSFPPTNIPFPESDYLHDMGKFISTEVFPDKYGSWWTHGWERVSAPYNYIQFIPSTLSTGEVASVETAVDGSYLDELTYHISFKVVLPPHTEIDVVLKDVKSDDMFCPDWATGIITGTHPSPYSTNFDVGPGRTYDATGTIVTPTPGHYINNGPYSETITITTVSPATVTATHFVDRLEFGAHTLTSYTGGNVQLDNPKFRNRP